MNKIISIFAKTVIVLTFLSLFGWLVKHITIGDKNFGLINIPVKYLSDFPDLFKKTAKEVASLPETFIKTPIDFSPINDLTYDVCALISYSNIESGRTVEIRNLRNDSVLRSWNVKLDQDFRPHDRIIDPILIPGNSLVYSNNGGTGLFMIDSLSKRVWTQDSIIHHHAMNLDSEGNIWACSYIKDPELHIGYRGQYFLDGVEKRFIDNSIVKLDINNGHKIFEKSITEILFENDLEKMILRSGNSEDPLHLNDVQPALRSTEFYDEGDVFLSFRNSSFILHYRPSTNELLKVLEGPFSCQHDVDLYNDSTLAFFNNNTHFLSAKHEGRMNNWDDPILIGDYFSEVLLYDFRTDTYKSHQDSTMKANEIFTFTEGGQEFLDEYTVFIEEQNSGVLWILENEKVIYKNVLNSQHEGYHHLPNWTKLIKDYK